MTVLALTAGVAVGVAVGGLWVLAHMLEMMEAE